MSRFGAWTLALALALPCAAAAQEVDPDLLDPDLGDDLLDDEPTEAAAAPLPPGVAEPPADTKGKVDGVGQTLRQEGDTAGQELHHDLYDLASRDTAVAEAQVQSRIESSEQDLSSLRGEVATLLQEQGGVDMSRGGAKGYGGPVEVGRRGRVVTSARQALVGTRFDADPLGRPMWGWWEALLNATCRGLPEVLHPLAAHRVNGMKAEADRMALSVPPHLRPYVDHVTRSSVLASDLGRFALEPPHDRRVNDLFTLGGKRGREKAQEAERGGKSRPLDIDLPVEAVKVERLPRDPATGKPVIDYPLGMPANNAHR